VKRAVAIRDLLLAHTSGSIGHLGLVIGHFLDDLLFLLAE